MLLLRKQKPYKYIENALQIEPAGHWKCKSHTKTIVKLQNTYPEMTMVPPRLPGPPKRSGRRVPNHSNTGPLKMQKPFKDLTKTIIKLKTNNPETTMAPGSLGSTIFVRALVFKFCHCFCMVFALSGGSQNQFSWFYKCCCMVFVFSVALSIDYMNV